MTTMIPQKAKFLEMEFKNFPSWRMEPHRQSPWYLHEIPAYAHRHWNPSVRQCQGFGGLSASCEIRRSSTAHRHRMIRTRLTHSSTDKSRGLLRRRIKFVPQNNTIPLSFQYYPILPNPDLGDRLCEWNEAVSLFPEDCHAPFRCSQWHLGKRIFFFKSGFGNPCPSIFPLLIFSVRRF